MRPSKPCRDRATRFVRRIRARLAADRGNASLEFLTVGLLLLVPLVYLVIAMAEIQGGTLAVEGAARQAARVYARAENVEAGEAAADRAVRIAFADSGLETGDAEVDLDCLGGDCLEPGSSVRFSVTTRVTLPLVPALFSLDRLASIPVNGTATLPVSKFGGAE
ncbi:hypothetical protein [Agromyces archimandritae]|uniref:Pilus assembly protein n=1 Tax=Agromyces archimandritae TaxID=2781962 RepID=A0A975FMP1_9MICO|nr:hypothetical protein [Agromyces archimandritae]QTX04318.1 hypothetical protein G127AT_13720 [Agromyces archimandritae]